MDEQASACHRPPLFSSQRPQPKSATQSPKSALGGPFFPDSRPDSPASPPPGPGDFHARREATGCWRMPIPGSVRAGLGERVRGGPGPLSIPHTYVPITFMPCRSASSRSACNRDQRRRPHGSPMPARRQGGPAPPRRLRPYNDRGLCTVMDWRSPGGDPCLASAPSDDGDPGGIPPRPPHLPPVGAGGRVPEAGHGRPGPPPIRSDLTGTP